MSYDSSFGLPPDYQINAEAITSEKVGDNIYWTDEVINSSRYFQYGVYKFARQLVIEKNCRSIVDIGCGPAMKAVQFFGGIPELSLTGIDQQKPIDFCNTQHSVGTWIADDFDDPSSEIPITRSDFIVCSDVIEHVVDPVKLLDYMKRLMDHQSYALISTPDRHRLLGRGARKPFNPHHVREWSFKEFAAFIDSQGFNILSHTRALGVKAGTNKPFRQTLMRHLRYGRPKSLWTNQMVLLKLKP